MPVMTLQQWTSKTSRIFTDRKNPLITDIDALLAAYHAPGATNVQKQKLLILIRQYCREWVTQMPDKKSTFRKRYLDDLLDQTAQELQSPAMQQATQDRRAGGAQPQAGKQMHESMIEVLQPRASATAKHGLTANLNLTRSSAPAIKTLTEQRGIDETDMLAVLDAIQDARRKGNLKRNLEYLQKGERAAFLLDKGADGLFHRGGDPSPRSSVAGERDMYAIDQMEFLYTAPAPKTGGTFHHSSFLSGKPVLCAGEMELQQGVITHVDNGSGHYQPTTKHLVDCVSLLQRKFGVDLSRVSIADFSQPNASWSSAQQFLLRNGSPVPASLPQPSQGAPAVADRRVVRGRIPLGGHRR